MSICPFFFFFFFIYQMFVQLFLFNEIYQGPMMGPKLL